MVMILGIVLTLTIIFYWLLIIILVMRKRKALNTKIKYTIYTLEHKNSIQRVFAGCTYKKKMIKKMYKSINKDYFKVWIVKEKEK